MDQTCVLLVAHQHVSAARSSPISDCAGPNSLLRSVLLVLTWKKGSMRTVLAVLIATLLAGGTFSTAFASGQQKANPQQERMKACNAEAGDKKGEERKAFMAKCLKGDSAMPMSQQDKMKKCNADANTKSMKGDQRKAFMSECLKADKKM